MFFLVMTTLRAFSLDSFHRSYVLLVGEKVKQGPSIVIEKTHELQQSEGGELASPESPGEGDGRRHSAGEEPPPPGAAGRLAQVTGGLSAGDMPGGPG